MHLSTYLVPGVYLVPVVCVAGDNKFVKRAYIIYSLLLIFLYTFHWYYNVDGIIYV